MWKRDRRWLNWNFETTITRPAPLTGDVDEAYQDYVYALHIDDRVIWRVWIIAIVGYSKLHPKGYRSYLPDPEMVFGAFELTPEEEQMFIQQHYEDLAEQLAD